MLTLWDVLLMTKVEERAMSCSVGVPLPVEQEVQQHGLGVVRCASGGGEQPAGLFAALTTAVPRPPVETAGKGTSV